MQKDPDSQCAVQHEESQLLDAHAKQAHWMPRDCALPNPTTTHSPVQLSAEAECLMGRECERVGQEGRQNDQQAQRGAFLGVPALQNTISAMRTGGDGQKGDSQKIYEASKPLAMDQLFSVF
ncbi:hypothetical protein CBR_g23140 [Chara braunii]|uniref:Uncharacterized protein n=1 Tax=Chara braunii TaxID=69332 RepID=A0A388L3P5_CHABU|nr:hypothetical protein CBR_g23140 [Chara braunii]|eukprot:GBG76926.1 hypothetical protein CBR_g23140 [Chara braunii]